ncbi:hypothetical protein BDL97_11G071800 [Sphagnum fallax]|nr:hypothetical protein BDL97_11G071800 [Sphagnum fallax]
MEEEVGTNNSSKFVYGTTPQHCQQMINHSLAHHPMVKFVRGALEKAGCPVGDKFFKPEECSMQVGGGFKRDDGVVICSNHVMLQDEVDVALTHELLHAYDHCRAANLDWTNYSCSQLKWRLPMETGAEPWQFQYPRAASDLCQAEGTNQCGIESTLLPRPGYSSCRQCLEHLLQGYTTI